MKIAQIATPFANAPDLVLTEIEIQLIKDLRNGELNKERQQMFFQMLVFKICRLQGPSHANNPHDSARNEGQRLVGIYLNDIANKPFDELITKERQ